MNRRWFLTGLAALLVVGGVAEARMHAPYRGHHIVPGGGAPLDGFTQPSGAYSFRLLRKAYLGTGAAVRIRRASDNAESDIGFSGSNDFDTVSAAAFCAATTCFVVTRYDQSGNAKHLTQATPANQPQLIFNCNGTLPCMQTTTNTQVVASASMTPATGIVSLSTVANRSAGTAICGWIRQNGAVNRLTTSNVASTWFVSSTGNITATGVADNAWHAATGVIAGASSVFNLDGVETTGTVTGAVTAGATQEIGGATTTCNFAESIVWDNYQLTPAERTALASNQRSYYMPAALDTFTTPSGAYSFRKLKSTYAGPAIRIRRASDNLETDINFLSCTGFTGCPWDSAAANAHCNSTTCFVRTIYDQSGNVRDWGQATPANQPQLIFNCIGSLPCYQMTVTTQVLIGASLAPATGIVSLSGVAGRFGGTAGQCMPIRQNGITGNRLQVGGAAATLTLAGGTSGSIIVAAADNAWHAMQGVVAGASSVLNLDGTETTGTATGSTTAAIPGNSTTVVAPVLCNIAESVWWDNYQLTVGERAALSSNQRSFWGF